ncbi:MAG: helix-turn-helix domain-containing protein [Lachnospirales bacterium]
MKFERLRNLREDMDLTQEYIGKLLNVSQRSYSNYESGNRAIPIEILIKLSEFYNTSIDYLVGKTDIKTPYPKH